MAGTEMGEVGAPGGATLAQRWLARLALVAATAAVLVAPVVAGLGQSLALVLVGLAGLAVTLAGVWWALTNKGLVRGLAVALAVAAPLGVLVLSTGARLTWVVLVAFGLLALGVAAGRAALGRDAIPERMQDPDRIWPGLGGGPVTLRRSPSEAVRLQERSGKGQVQPDLGEVALGMTESPAVSVPGRWAQNAVDRERLGGGTIWPKRRISSNTSTPTRPRS